jgi:glycosyltransferase involved in cell wall biosynthesis
MSNSWLKTDFVPGLVSVIVPLYNQAEYVGGTLDSLLASTYRPIEIIVVNKSSKDASGAVVAKWISQLPKDNVFQAKLLEQPNSGASAARNYGAMQSRGEFIHFLDADDMVVPVWYEYSIRTMQAHKECGLVWAGWKTADNNSMEEALRWCMEHAAVYSDGILTDETPIFGGNTMFRHDAIARVGSQYEKVYHGDDVDYYLRVLMHGIIIRRLPCTLFIYRQHLEQGSRDHSWGATDSLLRAIVHAESLQAEIAIPSHLACRVRKQFAVVFRNAVFRSIVGKHKDLALRAGKGFKRHAMAVPFRHRVQLSLLISLAGLGWFSAAAAAGRFLYGIGSLTGTPVSKTTQTSKI